MLRNSWILYLKHAKAFAEPLVWMLVPNVILSILPLLPGATDRTAPILSIISLPIMLWATVRMIDIAWTIYEGRAPAESLTRSLSWGNVGRIIDYVLVSSLLAAILFGGILLAVIPAFIFAVWFGFTPLAFLLEGTSPGTAALRRSKELVSGRFWQILWRWIVVSGLPVVLLIVALAIIAAAIALFTGTSASAADNWMISLLTSAVSVLLAPFFTAGSVIIFAEARKAR